MDSEISISRRQGAGGAIVRLYMPTLGLGLFFTWQQMAMTPLLALGERAAFFPAQLLMPLMLVVVLVAYVGLRMPVSRPLVVGATLALSVCGLAATAAPADFGAVQAVLLGLQALCAAVMLVAWNACVSDLEWPKTAVVVFGAAFLASIAEWALALGDIHVMRALSSEFVSGAALSDASLAALTASRVLTVLLPPLSCLFLLVSDASCGFLPQTYRKPSFKTPGAAERPSHDAAYGTENRLSLFLAQRGYLDLPWVPLLVLSFCGLLCAVTIGLNANPFVINSRTLDAGSSLIAAALSLIALLAVCISRDKPLSLVLVLAPLCFLIGLVAYAVGIANSPVYPLCIIMASHTLMQATLWVLVARVVRTRGLDRCVLFSLCLAVGGLPFGEQLGISIAAATGIDLASLHVLALGGAILVAAAVGLLVANEQAQARLRSTAQRLGLEYSGSDVRSVEVMSALARREGDAKGGAEASAPRPGDDPRVQAACEREDDGAGGPAETVPVRVHVPEPTIDAHEFFKQHGLTERETEVMILVVRGYPNGSIAEKLFITERTVKFHVSNSYNKLGVHSRKDLALLLDRD